MNGKIKNIAKKVRKAVEKLAKSDNYYSFDKNLKCACALASYFLSKELNKNKIKSKVVWGNFIKGKKNYSHCWVVVKNQIVDITATQFGIKHKVYITDIDSEQYYPVLEGKIAVKSLKDWNPEQNPFNYSIRDHGLGVCLRSKL